MKKWFKDLLSEKKDGTATGTPSMTRVAMLVVLVGWGGLAIASGISETIQVPQTIEFTLWGLFGLKGVTSSAKAIKGSGG